MHTYPLAAYMSHIDAGRWEDVASMLLASAEKLRQAGADLLICPDNTVHQAIGEARSRGVEAAVLGCTEIPLLMGAGAADSPLPTLDSTRILARAALREAVREDAGRAEP